MAWSDASTSPLNQLIQTMGRGVTPDWQSVLQGFRSLAEANADEDARRWDLDYGLKKKQLDQQWWTARQSARTARERNEIDRWYNEQQVALARERLAEDARQFNVSTGYKLLETAASLRGPRNYFQAAAFSRGAANDPNTAPFLNALRTNVRMPDFGAQAGVPEPVSLQSLMSDLGGGGQPAAAPAPNVGAIGSQGQTRPGGDPNTSTQGGDDARLGQIRNLYAQGAHKLGGGALENLTGTELGLLESGVDAAGGDWATFLDQYRRSRVGQGLGSRGAA